MVGNSIIDPTAIIEGTVGNFCVIGAGVHIKRNVHLGDHCIVDSGVEIGDKTVIQSNVELREGTKIGAQCYIDSGVKASGECVIGDGVTLRYGVIIARGVQVGNDSYLAPRVMTNNLDNEQVKIGGAKIGSNVFIGTHSVIHHGVEIGDKTTIGSMSFVNKSISGGTWVGCPISRIP